MKKAQAWGTDLAIAFVIFSLGIIFFYFYSFNYSNEAEDILETLSYEGNYITDILLSEGYPKNWTESDVRKIGLLEDNRLNQEKIGLFYSLSLSDYNKTKALFNTRYDYYFFLSEPIIINSNEIDGIGMPGVDRTNISSNNLMRITRFSVYENKPATVYLYIFEK